MEEMGVTGEERIGVSARKELKRFSLQTKNCGPGSVNNGNKTKKRRQEND